MSATILLLVLAAQAQCVDRIGKPCPRGVRAPVSEPAAVVGRVDPKIALCHAQGGLWVDLEVGGGQAQASGRSSCADGCWDDTLRFSLSDPGRTIRGCIVPPPTLKPSDFTADPERPR